MKHERNAAKQNDRLTWALRLTAFVQMSSVLRKHAERYTQSQTLLLKEDLRCKETNELKTE